MSKKSNEDMAGSVSEPKGAIPEVKPAKSLWPRPHETVRVEPVLDPPQQEAPPVAPPVVSLVEPVSEYSAPADEGDRAPEVRIEPEEEYAAPVEPDRVEAELEPVSEIEDTPPEGSAPDEVAEDESKEDGSEPEQPREEPVLAAPSLVADEPAMASEPEPVAPPIREDRHVSVLDAAGQQRPALDDPRENNTGKFVAMAAGIVVALALGTVAFVYGSSALGLKFGGDSGTSDTTASTAAPSATPVVNADEVKAMEERVAALQAELEKLKQEKSAAAPSAAETPAAESAPSAPQPGPVASIPGATPAPRASSAPAAEPAPTPSPAPQAAAPAPASEPTPPTSTTNTAPQNETVRVEPTPAPSATAPAPPPAPKPKPPETARAEPAPAPPPSYQTQPTYQQPRETSSPEMPVLQNWAVRDVYNGIAVVQGGRGAPLEVEPGDELPGGNRVLAIRRLGGNWAVITERGIISGY